jgi:arylsulfate sulfotransferase
VRLRLKDDRGNQSTEAQLTKHPENHSFMFDPRAKLVFFLAVFIPVLSTVGCGGGSTTTSRSELHTSRLGQTQLVPTANLLVAQYTVSTSAAGSVSVQFGPDTKYAFTTSPQLIPQGGGTVTLLVAGMKQKTLYHMRAVVAYEDGTKEVDEDHTFQTLTLPPERLPKIQVTIPPGLTPTPGVELLSLIGGVANQLVALALDPAGNIVWYYDYNELSAVPDLTKLLPNGHMLMIVYLPGPPDRTAIREVDLAGNMIRQFDSSQLSQKLHDAGYNIQIYSIDHDVLSLPNGHLLLLTTDTRVYTDLPGYPGQTTVSGNAIIDLDASNNPVWVWDAFDHLDVNRHPMYFPDWTHANSLFYSPDDGNLLFSLRHQHWVLKIDYANGNGAGDILWKLGYQGDFTLDSHSPSDWFYAQHYANIVSPNTTGDFSLALFDNGDFRVLDDDGTQCSETGPPQCYSTAAIFEVNESTMTASRKWSYTTPYSFWGGVTQVLSNSNVFFNETAPADLDLKSSRVMEVTQDANPTVLWQLEIDGQNSYRTIHLPSLYPDVQW